MRTYTLVELRDAERALERLRLTLRDARFADNKSAWDFLRHREEEVEKIKAALARQ
jgi:hypothetical protein